MRIGFVGLGKMGANMTLRLTVGSEDGSAGGGHEVVGYDPKPVKQLQGVAGVNLVQSLDALVEALPTPRRVWVMVPAGNAAESVIGALSGKLAPGDVLIDGGNSFYKDTIRRAQSLRHKQIQSVDVGTSGGIWGRSVGYCMMIGGEESTVNGLRPIFDSLAPPDGWAYMGDHGAGHFVKMVHNGIEYGLMEAYGEGFELLRHSPFEPDLHAVAKVWNHGSVIRSWLLELAEKMFEVESDLRTIQPYVEDSGEGRWTVQAALEQNVPAPVIAASLFARFQSRDKEDFSARFCAALRKQFGGHDVVRKDLTEKADTHELHGDHPAPPK